MRLVVALAALFISTFAQAQTPLVAQGSADMALDKTGPCLNLSVRDPRTPSGSPRRPLGCLDTTDFVGINDLKTVADAVNYHPVTAPPFLRPQGKTVVGIGGALYEKVASQPSHAFKFSITLQDGTVVWYGLAKSEYGRASPDMVGALGNSIGSSNTGADDTAALTASQTLGVAVHLRAGAIYRVTTNVVISANAGLIGPSNLRNATIFCDPLGGTGVGFVPDYTSPNRYIPKASCINAAGGNGTEKDGVTLQDFTIDWGGNTGANGVRCCQAIWAGYTKNLVIRNIEIKNGSANGIRYGQTFGGWIQDNYVHDFTNTTGLEYSGIEGDNDSFVESTGLVITGNRVINMLVSKTGFENTFSDPLLPDGYQPNGIKLIKGNHFTVTGNVSENAGQNYDFYIDDSTIANNIAKNGLGFCLPLKHSVHRNIVANNDLQNCGAAGIALAGDAAPNDASDNLVIGNRVTGVQNGDWADVDQGWGPHTIGMTPPATSFTAGFDLPGVDGACLFTGVNSVRNTMVWNSCDPGSHGDYMWRAGAGAGFVNYWFGNYGKPGIGSMNAGRWYMNGDGEPDSIHDDADIRGYKPWKDTAIVGSMVSLDGGNLINVTGSATTILDFIYGAKGQVYYVKFNGANPINCPATTGTSTGNLVCPSAGTNFTTAAGDTMVLTPEIPKDTRAGIGGIGGLYRILSYHRATGEAFLIYSVRSIESFGCKGDDTNDDTACVNSAIASGVPISGYGKVYRVNGSINVRNGIDLRDATFLQTSTATDVRTLTDNCACSGPYTLRRVKIDHSLRLTTSGTISGTAGIWFSANGGAVHDVLLEDVEFTGNGAGSGIFVTGGSSPAKNIKMVRPWVHDMEWSATIDPGQEQMQGIRCSTCENVAIIEPRVENLTGFIPWTASTSLAVSQGLPWRVNASNSYRATALAGTTGTTAPTCTGTPGVSTCSDGSVTWTYMGPLTTAKRAYQADGVDYSACVSGCSIQGGVISNVWEGTDMSGGGVNNDVWIYGTLYKDIDSWGQKWAHTPTNGGSVGTRVIRAGLGAYVFSGGIIPDVGAPTNMLIADAVAYNTGSSGNWLNSKLGFSASGGTDFPYSNVRLVNTSAIDDQAVHTMTYGYSHSIPNAAFQLVNPYISGALTADYNGAPIRIGTTPTGIDAVGVLGVTGKITTTAAVEASTGLSTTSGFLRIQRNAVVLANPAGLNSDIVTAYGNITLTGATGPFSVGGFVPSVGGVGVLDGQRLWVYNSAAQPMTIVNEDVSSTAANRIKTMTGANVVMLAAQSYAEFVYTNLNSRWILLSTTPYGVGSGPMGLGTAALENKGTNGATLGLLNTANTFSARQTGLITSAGVETFPLALQNAANSAATGVGIDFAPNTNGFGGRSAAIVSTTVTGSEADLQLRTANGSAPTTRLIIAPAGGIYTAGATGGSQGNNTINATALYASGGTGTVSAGAIDLSSSTVALLPTCNAGAEGMIRGVTDGNAPTYLGAAAGGGAVHAPVYCNGTGWVFH